MTILPLVAVALVLVGFLAVLNEVETVDPVKVLAEACRVKEAERLTESLEENQRLMKENETEVRDTLAAHSTNFYTMYMKA